MSETIGIASLGVSPVKSAKYYGGIESLSFNPDGTFGDREYMFVELEPHIMDIYPGHKGEVANPGQFLSQREDPELTTVHAEIGPEALTLDHARLGELVVPKFDARRHLLRQVSVWGWHGVALDQGNEAAEWASELVGRPVGLVRVSAEHPRFVEGNPGLGVVGFADGYPLLVTSTASFDAVNEELAKRGKGPIDAATFRPNIVLEADGREPFFEDEIGYFEFTANKLVWRAARVKPCSRCIMIDHDPDTGDLRPGVQRALKDLGRLGTYANLGYGDKEKLFFGQNFTVFPPVNAAKFVNSLLWRSSELRVNYADHNNWNPVAQN